MSLGEFPTKEADQRRRGLSNIQPHVAELASMIARLERSEQVSILHLLGIIVTETSGEALQSQQTPDLASCIPLRQ